MQLIPRHIPVTVFWWTNYWRLKLNNFVIHLYRITWIKISWCELSNNSLVYAFVVHVRPILEFYSVAWSPYLNCETEEIEKVQRHFTKRLEELKNISNSDRLCRLALPSLELRRYHIDLIFCYKLPFRLVSVKFPCFFEFSLVQKTRGHSYRLYTVSGKRGHVIFNYSSRIPWSIFIIFVPLETGMNAPQMHEIYLLKIFVTS